MKGNIERQSELKTLEWNILYPNRLLNLEINYKRRLRKRVDQALIPISTIQKFPAMHSRMPRPLAPDPIRVQSCVCCLFWTNRNCKAVTYLSFYLSHYPIRVMNSSIGANCKWKYLLLLKLWCMYSWELQNDGYRV